VKSARQVITAVLLLLSVVAMASAPALAASRHPVCTTQQHDCGKAPTIKPCCCGDQGTGSDEGGPVAAKTRIGATLIAGDFLPVSALLPSAVRTTVSVQTSPPRAVRVDLPTLFASLLI
jgi:hypothetical protein